MKKLLGILLTLLLGISVYYSMFSNPIVVNVINEFMFTSEGWILEFKPQFTPMNMNDWILITRDDTAQFKPFIQNSSATHYIFTEDSLLEPIRLHKTGDSLVIMSISHGKMGFLTFGNLTTASVPVPKTGQSISRGSDCWYLDNTPTLGALNDTINANGRIACLVKDGQGNPLSQVKVSYLRWTNGYPYFDGWGPDTILTDVNGFCMISSLALRQPISLNIQNFVRQSFIIQIWPESTVTMNVTMSPVVSVDKRKDQGIPKTFSLGEPYPNPFNPETQIPYTLAHKGNVDLSVFDMSGKRVDNIFSGYQSAGSYHVRWNAALFPSGIYFIRLRTQETILSTRCVLVK